jgi:hypothetical protein
MTTSALDQAGATREPSEYAALSMDRQFTGLWTQRSPLRDADVPYLYGKFYSASRFDSLIDGLNREITSRLSDARRFGNSPYNSSFIFPALNSFYSYKRIVSGTEVVRVMADGQDGVIYDATAGQKTALFTKASGAGKARFAAVNTALYFADGAENKKWLQPATWAAQTALATSTYEVGTIVIDSNGKLEYLSAMQVGTISKVQVTANAVILTFSPTNFNVVQGMNITPAGLTGASFLNGQPLVVQAITTSGSNFLVTAQYVGANYAATSDSGTATTGDVGTIATTGGSAPSWSGTVGGTTADGLSTWTNFGVPIYNWGAPAAPTSAPIIVEPSLGTAMVFWQPLRVFSTFIITATLIDANGMIWRITAGAGRGGTTGTSLPKFTNYPIVNSSGVQTGSLADGGYTWTQSLWLGSDSFYVATGPAGWLASIAPFKIGVGGGDVCVDSNGNLQQLTAGTGNTGATAPIWNTTYGGNTADNGLTWTNLGPYLAIAFQGFEYGYAYHCIDGSVSTLSPLTETTNGVLNGVQVGGNYSTDPQVDSVWIFRTADGESTPLFLAAIPNNTAGGTWSFLDQNSDNVLDAEIAGPQAGANNPPPVGMTAPVYHQGCIWAIYQNTVIKSGGPDVLVGNGNTAFAALSSFPITEQPIRLFPGMTTQGPALFIWGTTNLWAILGAGTVDSPFQQASIYMGDVGILSYDAICMVGSTAYAFTSKGKAASLDPSAGYVEYGFPIGDQFVDVTTGAGAQVPTGAPMGALYSPGSTFVTWAELSSADTAIYVSDGAVGWFRYSPVASPESGFLWSPRAVIVGGISAVQAVETTPGISQLLLGPAAVSGVCSVSGTAVTWTSGLKFSAALVGTKISLGGTFYMVATYVSPTAITIGTSLGAATGVSFGIAGPILFRDSTVNADWSQGYQAYPSYDVKGSIVLCDSGEVAEIAHIALKSTAVGARPVAGLLLGELAPSTEVPWDWLEVTSNDPPDLQASQTMYSDRYVALQNGVTPKCDNFQLAIDYGTQNVPDELLKFSVYGAKHAERRQQ